MGKPFHDANFLMAFIPEDNLFGEHIRDARELKLMCESMRHNY